MSISNDSGLHQAEERFMAAKTRLLSLFGSSEGSSAADSGKEAEPSPYAERKHEATDQTSALDYHNDSSRPSTAMRANSAMHLGALPVQHGPARDSDILQSAEVSLILHEPKHHESIFSSRHAKRVTGHLGETCWVEYKTQYEQQMDHLPDTYKGTYPADHSKQLSRDTTEDRESGAVLAASQARMSASRECSLRPFDGTRIPAIPLAAGGAEAEVARAQLQSQPHVAHKSRSRGRRHPSFSKQKAPTAGPDRRSIATTRSKPAFDLRTGPAHEKALREEMQRAEQQLRRRHALEVRRRRRLLHQMGRGSLGAADKGGSYMQGMAGTRPARQEAQKSPGPRLEAGQRRTSGAGGGRTTRARTRSRSMSRQVDLDRGSQIQGEARMTPVGSHPVDGYSQGGLSHRRSSAASSGNETRHGPSRAGHAGQSRAGRAGQSRAGRAGQSRAGHAGQSKGPRQAKKR